MACEKCGTSCPEALDSTCSSTAALICTECGDVLSMDERHWYGTTCEACEIAHHERIEAWRKGGDDPEFDDAFKGDTLGIN